MYKPSYDASGDYYYFSPDHYEELFEKWENKYGRCEEWDDDTIENYIIATTGDTPKSFKFDKSVLLIRYTV